MIKLGTIILLLVTTGCTLNSKFGLPKSNNIDKGLLGTWTTPCILNQDSDTLTIQSINNKDYKLQFESNEKMTAYTLKIKNHKMINIVSNIDGNNFFYGYEIQNDTLRFYEVNTALIKHQITSKKELYDYFLFNIDKHDFFMNPCIMIRN